MLWRRVVVPPCNTKYSLNPHFIVQRPLAQERNGLHARCFYLAPFVLSRTRILSMMKKTAGQTLRQGQKPLQVAARRMKNSASKWNCCIFYFVFLCSCWPCLSLAFTCFYKVSLSGRAIKRNWFFTEIRLNVNGSVAFLFFRLLKLWPVEIVPDCMRCWFVGPCSLSVSFARSLGWDRWGNTFSHLFRGYGVHLFGFLFQKRKIPVILIHVLWWTRPALGSQRAVQLHSNVNAHLDFMENHVPNLSSFLATMPWRGHRRMEKQVIVRIPSTNRGGQFSASRIMKQPRLCIGLLHFFAVWNVLKVHNEALRIINLCSEWRSLHLKKIASKKLLF